MKWLFVNAHCVFYISDVSTVSKQYRVKNSCFDVSSIVSTRKHNMYMWSIFQTAPYLCKIFSAE